MGYNWYRPSRKVFGAVLPKTVPGPFLHCRRWHLFFNRDRLLRDTTFCRNVTEDLEHQGSRLCLTPSRLLHQTGRGDDPASGPEGTGTRWKQSEKGCKALGLSHGFMPQDFLSVNGFQASWMICCQFMSMPPTSNTQINKSGWDA